MQTGFFEFVVLPMFAKFTTVFPASTPILDLALDNYQVGATRCRVATSFNHLRNLLAALEGEAAALVCVPGERVGATASKQE